MLDKYGLCSGVRGAAAVVGRAHDRRGLHGEPAGRTMSLRCGGRCGPATPPRRWGRRTVQLWLAREGTLCAEGKDPVEKIGAAEGRASTQMLAYDPRRCKVLVEPKPNEPIDRSYCGTASGMRWR